MGTLYQPNSYPSKMYSKAISANFQHEEDETSDFFSGTFKRVPVIFKIENTRRDMEMMSHA